MKNQVETQTEKTQPSALAVMGRQLSVDPAKLLETLKATVFKGANDNELLALVVVANTYGLNPLLREIYAFPAKGGGITPVVSVDGWISMVNRQPTLDGLEFEWSDLAGEDDITSLSCTCTIYLKDRGHPVKVTEFYKECFRSTEPWKQMPRRMLRHKALKEAARIAFGFSGVTDEDEARDIVRGFPPPREVKIETTTKKVVEKPEFPENAEVTPEEADRIQAEQDAEWFKENTKK